MMELPNIKFGLSSHFSKLDWEKETKYLGLCVEVMEKDLKIHHEVVSSAFQNILAFLKSINKTDRRQSMDLYDSVLKVDPYNLNALVGLSEMTPNPNKKKLCEQKVKEMPSEIQKRAVPKAMLEIGIALCLLIPRYQFENANSDDCDKPCNRTEFDGFENLVFQTENTTLEVDLYKDTHKAQKKRVYGAVRYLEEGIERVKKIEPERNGKDMIVWKHFLAMAYNRLDNWIAQTYGSIELRKQLSLNALKLFCEVAASSDPNSGDQYERRYFQRSLAYIGQILVSRKNNVFLSFEDKNYIPECFLKYEGHFIRKLWDEPEESFLRALEYGYDPTVKTRYAKYLLHKNNYEAAIAHINEVFENGDHNWYSASIRLTAYKQKYTKMWRTAKEERDFSSLTKDYLIKAETDGEYCFNTFATAKDQSSYASILRWLGTFPDGEHVTDESKIESALIVLNRIYEEQGCHTHFKVHKVMAECHKDMADLGEAIKYAIWSLNSTPDVFEVFPRSFSLLINFMLETFEQNSATCTQDKKCPLLRQIRYYVQSEINRRCHELIRIKVNVKELQPKNETLANAFQALLERYDESVVNEIKLSIKTVLHQQIKDQVLTVINNFGVLFSIVQKWCRRFPDAVKALLDFTIDTATTGPLQTFVKMSLRCLGKEHKEWTQQYNRKWREIAPKSESRELDLFTSDREDYSEKEHFDYLMINAPEDRDWVLYTFLPEMEQRPKTFEGCIPDRDFKKGETFENNMINGLAKTNKVLLALTNNFLKRIHELLGGEHSLLEKLDKMHSNRKIDVIILFVDAVTLNLKDNAVLVNFDNVDSSSYGLEWNYLRKLLARPIRPSGTTRDTVKWKADASENDLLYTPHREKDEDLYKAIAQDICPYGIPQAEYILYHQAFIIGYDGEKRIPRWVAHRIDSKTKRGVVNRKTHKKQLRNYREDTSIPPQARSSKKDYESTKDLTRGHVTPLADHSSTLELAKETNIMTNMVPEVKHNCLWNRLEEYCRDCLTKDFETIYVMSGTLFLTITEGGEEFVKYKVIGRNKVAVPTDLFKVIVAKPPEDNPKVGTFTVPNKPFYDSELTDLTKSITWIEKQRGIELFRDIGEETKKAEISTLTTPFFTKEDRVCKMIRDVDSKDDLDIIWKCLTLEEQSKFQDKFADKLKHFENKKGKC